MSVNQKVYQALVAMGSNVAEGTQAKQLAERALGGAYDQGVLAASMAADRAEFEETMTLLIDNIQYGRDELHVKFGAERRTRDDKKGRLYKIPQSVSNVKTVCLSAFERNVPFTMVDAKTGKPRVRSFNEISKENRAAGERIDAEKAKELTGKERMEYDTRALLVKAGEAIAKLNEAGLKALHDALQTAVLSIAPTTAEAPKQAPTEAPKQAEAPTVESAQPAKPTKKGRKAAKTVSERLAA